MVLHILQVWLLVQAIYQHFMDGISRYNDRMIFMKKQDGYNYIFLSNSRNMLYNLPVAVLL